MVLNHRILEFLGLITALGIAPLVALLTSRRDSGIHSRFGETMVYKCSEAGSYSSWFKKERVLVQKQISAVCV